MRHIRDIYGVRKDLVIVSDMNTSIPKAVHKVFPKSKLAIRMQHFWGNVKTKFGKSFIQALFYRCAKAYTQESLTFFYEYTFMLQ